MKNPDNKSRKNVLVAVLKDQRDLDLLLREQWYRIPKTYLPKRKFTHIAFYQPAIFGKKGKRINYYARVLGRAEYKRIELLPNEANHPRANDTYCKFTFNKIIELERPVRNIIPRRVSFGFTDLKSLHRANDILELYHVPKTEQVVAGALKQLGIETKSEHTVMDPKTKHRVRVDLAIECVKGNIAIECDNDRAHASLTQQERDRIKDNLLECLGWKVVRLKEEDIIKRLNESLVLILGIVSSLGGVIHQRAKKVVV